MISVDDALRQILDRLSPVGTEVIPVADGLGRVLADDLAARRTHPSMPISSMDGYAVRSCDVTAAPTTLTCIATVAAGTNDVLPTIPSGACVRIFTGAPVPPDADSIVIQENTTTEAADGPSGAGYRVTITEPVLKTGQWVRPAGLDFREGDSLLKSGTRLRPVDIGMAAAMNHPWLTVRRRPRVAILATGDEVVLPGEPLTDRLLPSSNSLQLMSLVRQAGGEPLHLGIAPDDPEILSRMVSDAAKVADLIVTSGGASVGDHDHVRRLLGESDGGDLHFWKIAMRPGKPLMFGAVNGTPLIGLPGNPVACFVCGLLFVVPSIDRLSGSTAADIVRRRAMAMHRVKVAVDLDTNDMRQDYLRATLATGQDGSVEVTPFRKQDSSMMSLLAQSTALIVRPPYAEFTPAGEYVPIIML